MQSLQMDKLAERLADTALARGAYKQADAWSPVLGAVLGSGLGAGAGYLNARRGAADPEDFKKRVRRQVLLGALAGAPVGAGAGAWLGRGQTPAPDTAVEPAAAPAPISGGPESLLPPETKVPGVVGPVLRGGGYALQHWGLPAAATGGGYYAGGAAGRQLIDKPLMNRSSRVNDLFKVPATVLSQEIQIGNQKLPLETYLQRLGVDPTEFAKRMQQGRVRPSSNSAPQWQGVRGLGSYLRGGADYLRRKHTPDWLPENLSAKVLKALEGSTDRGGQRDRFRGVDRMASEAAAAQQPGAAPRPDLPKPEAINAQLKDLLEKSQLGHLGARAVPVEQRVRGVSAANLPSDEAMRQDFERSKRQASQDIVRSLHDTTRSGGGSKKDKGGDKGGDKPARPQAGAGERWGRRVGAAPGILWAGSNLRDVLMNLVRETRDLNPAPTQAYEAAP